MLRAFVSNWHLGESNDPECGLITILRQLSSVLSEYAMPNHKLEPVLVAQLFLMIPKIFVVGISDILGIKAFQTS